MNKPESRNNPVDIKQVPSLLPSRAIDCHYTWHRFPEAYMAYYRDNWKVSKGKKFQSTANYDGASYADFIPFDFDCDSLGDALSLTRDFVARLDVDFSIRDGVQCYFSGSKGFHVCIPASVFGFWEPSEKLARQLKLLALRLAADEKIDDKIYDINRLLRIPLTINPKSGLYKIPIELDSLFELDISTILDMAKTRQEPKGPPRWDSWSASESAVALWMAVKDEYEKSKKSKSKEVVSVSDMFSTSLREGQQRDVRAFQLACRLRDSKVPRDMAKQILSLWDRNLETPLTSTDGEDIIERKLDNAYGDLRIGDDRIKISDIRNIRELSDDYTAYIKTLKERRITTGISTIDKAIRGIAPGEVFVFFAKTSVGKTVTVQNVLKHIVKAHDTPAAFCSMEQPKAQVFERFAQMTTLQHGIDLERNWESEEYRNRINANVFEAFGENLWVCDIPHLKLEELETIARLTAERAGRDVGVLAIDYIGLMDAKDLDRTLYGQISEAARGLKTLAKTLGLAIIELCQISRTQDDIGDKPVHISSARESGAIEESADFVVGLSRPNINPQCGQPDNVMLWQLLKNRKGPLLDVHCYFDGATMRVAELDDKGRLPDGETDRYIVNEKPPGHEAGGQWWNK